MPSEPQQRRPIRTAVKGETYRHYARRAVLQGGSEETCFDSTRKTAKQWLARSLTCTVPTRHDVTILIGTSQKGEAIGIFRELFARFILDDTNVPADQRAEVARFAGSARADSYFRMLETCWRLVLDVCARAGCEPLPMPVGVAIGIVVEMASVAYSLGYIRNVITTIATAHRLSGHSDPTKDERFRVIYNCIARRLGKGHPNAKAALFVCELIEMSQEFVPYANAERVQKWAIILMTFFSALRRINIATLRCSEVFDETSYLHLRIPQSKTDQYQQGHSVYLYALPSEPRLCPVRAYRKWLPFLGNDTSGTLFRHLGPLGTVTSKPIADRTVARTVQVAAKRIGLDPSLYGAQSLRAGLITEGLMNGVPEIEMAEHTDHHSLESLRKYFRPGKRRTNMSEAVVYGTPKAIAPASLQ